MWFRKYVLKHLQMELFDTWNLLQNNGGSWLGMVKGIEETILTMTW